MAPLSSDVTPASSAPIEPVVLRSATAEDAAALSLIGVATFLEAFAGVLFGSDILAHCQVQHAAERYAGWVANEHYRLCLAELKGAPIGFAVLSPPDLPLPLLPNDIELKRIYLLHRFQGTGLGRRLLEWSITEARAMGKQRLLLGVKADNRSAIQFYERHGFVRVGERKFLVGSMWCDDYLMARPLEG